MKQLLHLSISTPDRQVVELDDVSLVGAPGAEGDVGILPNHAPLLTKLKDGVVTYRINAVDHQVGVSHAFLDVADNVVTIITDLAILPDEADRVRAEQARQRAKEQLEKRLAGTDFQMVEAELRRALLELKLLEHTKK